MAYISRATADKFFNDNSRWNTLLDNRTKEKMLEDASRLLDRIVFKTDNDQTQFPRYDAGASPSRPAKGRLAWCVAYLAYWLSLTCFKSTKNPDDEAETGRVITDLGLRLNSRIAYENYEETNKIAGLETTKKFSEDENPRAIIPGLGDEIPRDIQLMIAPYAAHVSPKFQKMMADQTARPIKYVSGDE